MYPLLTPPRKLKLQPAYACIYLNNSYKGTIGINETGYFILSLCNGLNSIDFIVEKLAHQYKENKDIVSDYVYDFLFLSSKMGIVTLNSNPDYYPITIVGSTDFWTPEIVFLEITKNCPLLCTHCYVERLDIENNESTLNMDFSILKDLCSQIANLNIDRVQLTGGEPLIYPHICWLIEYLRKADIYTIITTSGIYCDSNIYNSLSLLKNGGGKVQVSIDGLEKTHNKLRGHSQSFSKAIYFLQKLIELEIEVDVATTLFEQTFDEIEQLCCYLKQLGIKRYRVGIVFNKGRASKNGYFVTHNYYIEFIKFIEYLKNKYESDGFKVSSDEYSNNNLNKNINQCGAGYKMLRISTNFNVYPCLMADYLIFDLKKNSLMDYIEQKSCKFSLIKSPNNEYCDKCDNLYLCNNCLAQGFIQAKRNMNCKWYNLNKNKFDSITLNLGR